MCVWEGFGVLIKCVGADVGLQSAASPGPLCGSYCSCQQSRSHTICAGCSCCFQCLLSMHSNAYLYKWDNESNYLNGSVLYIDFVSGVVLDTGFKGLQSQHFPVVLL